MVHVNRLKKEISAIILAIKKYDEVLLQLELLNAIIYGYNLALAQLQKLHKNKICLMIVSINKITANS